MNEHQNSNDELEEIEYDNNSNNCTRNNDNNGSNNHTDNDDGNDNNNCTGNNDNSNDGNNHTGNDDSNDNNNCTGNNDSNDSNNNSMKNQIRTILSLIGLNENGQNDVEFLYKLITKNYKNIIFCLTGLLLFCRIMYFCNDEGFYSYFNITYKYAAYFDNVVGDIINFIVLSGLLISSNYLLDVWLRKHDIKDGIKLYISVVFIIAIILFVIAYCLINGINIFSIKLLFNWHNLIVILKNLIAVSICVCLCYIYPLSNIIFTPENNSNDIHRNIRTFIAGIIFILATILTVSVMVGFFNGFTKKDFKTVIENNNIYAIIYENADKYIIEPINDDGTINKSIKKEISKEGITIYSLNNINNSKEREKIIKKSERYN